MGFYEYNKIPEGHKDHLNMVRKAYDFLKDTRH